MTFSDDFVLLNPRCVLPEFVMHVQLEWAAQHDPAIDNAGTTFASCHPATVYAVGEKSALSEDIAVRDNMMCSGGKLVRPLSGVSFGEDLVAYLKSNKDLARFRPHHGDLEIKDAKELGIGATG